MFSYNLNLYPTPQNVIDMMGIDCNGKVVLEPSAGLAHIVEYLKNNGAKEVLTCEFDNNLAEIVKTKSKFIKHDFLKVTAEEISHIDMIVANPPFSNGDKHIIHMWDIAPEGCEIISLVNWETYNNSYSYSRSELREIINTYGSCINLGDVFSTAERKTEAQIGLVKLYKPKTGNQEFEGFFMDEEPEELQENGIMKFDGIRDIVQRYIGSVKCFEEFEVISERMNYLAKPFKVGKLAFNIKNKEGRDEQIYTKDNFKKELQKKAWVMLFDKMNLNKYLTSNVMKDVNKFCETQHNVPFTMKNIYHMISIIVGTSGSNFEKALIEAVDNFTKHTDENRFFVEGWKSNSGHMLNKKIIIPHALNTYLGTPSFSGRYDDSLRDLIKVLCNITGTNYNHVASFDRIISYRYKLFQNGTFKGRMTYPNESKESYDWCFSNKLEEMEAIKKKAESFGIKCEIIDQEFQFGKWMDSHFFELRGYKKGTVHLKFKDDKVWEQLNRAYAKAKGQVLPEKFKFKEPKESKNKKETGLELIKY